MLYIKGQVYPVSFDSKEELARLKVTDMIIVEKEGVTDVLLYAAQKYRIALVATAGKFVDYVKDLMKLTYPLGRINVCVLTDYDIAGINMWREANEKWVSISRELVLLKI
jgi:DNA topoisomerase VI subunit A